MLANPVMIKIPVLKEKNVTVLGIVVVDICHLTAMTIMIALMISVYTEPCALVFPQRTAIDLVIRMIGLYLPSVVILTRRKAQFVETDAKPVMVRESVLTQSLLTVLMAIRGM
jgi:hypothetical protein